MKRLMLSLAVFSLFFLAVLLVLSRFAATADAQGPVNTTVAGETVVPAHFDGDVRNLPGVPQTDRPQLNLKAPPSHKQPPTEQPQSPSAPSPNAPKSSASMPPAVPNFDGLTYSTTVSGSRIGCGYPPDPNGDVGLNYYVEAVNCGFAIYNKTGAQLAAFTENQLWFGANTGTPCDAKNEGDPVVVYDQFRDRWFLTNFAFAFAGPNPVAPYYQCFAVSKTNDPVSGGYWLYAVRIDAGNVPNNTLNDYGKFGLWNDGCLYYGANGFLNASSYNGAIFGSFNKDDMENGVALTASNYGIGFLAYPANSVFSMFPANISGARQQPSLPPTATKEYFVSESITAFQFDVRKFTKAANCGAGGTLGAPAAVSQAPYDYPSDAGGDTDIVPQATTTNTLDTVDDRIMQKVQYRKVGITESLWVVHNVCRVFVNSGSPPCTSTVGEQWAQINVSTGTVASTPLQQQIYSDTLLYRWMGSIAADHVGDAALGFSTSSAQTFPSIFYAGRLVADPLNTLAQTETALIAGADAQTRACGSFVHCPRWGDYSAMSVDPVDDCTFWYINEYYPAATGGIGDWHTRIGAFKFQSCNSPTAVELDNFQATSSQPAVVSPEGDGVAGVLALLAALVGGAVGWNVLRGRSGR